MSITSLKGRLNPWSVYFLPLSSLQSVVEATDGKERETKAIKSMVKNVSSDIKHTKLRLYKKTGPSSSKMLRLCMSKTEELSQIKGDQKDRMTKCNMVSEMDTGPEKAITIPI